MSTDRLISIKSEANTETKAEPREKTLSKLMRALEHLIQFFYLTGSGSLIDASRALGYYTTYNGS